MFGLRLLALAACVVAASAFSPAFAGRGVARAVGSSPWGLAARTSTCSPRMNVVEVKSEGELDKTLAAADGGLVVIDYSTTWCGPCKVILPKFEEMSTKFTDAVFLKVIGDSSPGATKLMKREGVRSVPSFHFWKGGKKVDIVNGANSDAVEATILELLPKTNAPAQ